ncbi:MAG TPA: ABC transporter permease [Crenalkalicoccus sp.]|jgi:capsular polysaccharide transport system permease protein|nr:ABC transporter permease [Crenalkalicoccus sp.]
MTAAPGLGGAFAIQCRVLGALMLREMSSRFGRENLGFLWLFAEPAMLGGAIGALHHLSGHGLPGGVNVAVFWVLGYIPYYLFRGILNRAPVAVVGNQSLLYHRRVTLLDILLSRNLLEGAAVFGALLGFTLLFGLALGEWPRDPPKVVMGMAGMLALANGCALLIAAGSVYTELFERLVHLATYLTLPLLGAFYMVFWLPTELQRAALWIPTVHCFEMLREGQFGTQVPTTWDGVYLLAWIAVLNLFGLAALRAARRDLVL